MNTIRTSPASPHQVPPNHVVSVNKPSFLWRMVSVLVTGAVMLSYPTAGPNTVMRSPGLRQRLLPPLPGVLRSPAGLVSLPVDAYSKRVLPTITHDASTPRAVTVRAQSFGSVGNESESLSAPPALQPSLSQLEAEITQRLRKVYQGNLSQSSTNEHNIDMEEVAQTTELSWDDLDELIRPLLCQADRIFDQRPVPTLVREIKALVPTDTTDSNSHINFLDRMEEALVDSCTVSRRVRCVAAVAAIHFFTEFLAAQQFPKDAIERYLVRASFPKIKRQVVSGQISDSVIGATERQLNALFSALKRLCDELNTPQNVEKSKYAAMGNTIRKIAKHIAVKERDRYVGGLIAFRKAFDCDEEGRIERVFSARQSPQLDGQHEMRLVFGFMALALGNELSQLPLSELNLLELRLKRLCQVGQQTLATDALELMMLQLEDDPSEYSADRVVSFARQIASPQISDDELMRLITFVKLIDALPRTYLAEHMGSPIGKLEQVIANVLGPTDKILLQRLLATPAPLLGLIYLESLRTRSVYGKPAKAQHLRAYEAYIDAQSRGDAAVHKLRWQTNKAHQAEFPAELLKQWRHLTSQHPRLVRSDQVSSLKAVRIEPVYEDLGRKISCMDVSTSMNIGLLGLMMSWNIATVGIRGEDGQFKARSLLRLLMLTDSEASNKTPVLLMEKPYFARHLKHDERSFLGSRVIEHVKQVGDELALPIIGDYRDHDIKAAFDLLTTSVEKLDRGAIPRLVVQQKSLFT